MLLNGVRNFVFAALAGAYLAVAAPAFAQSPDPVDYLGIPGPIEFAGTQYHLAWSSRPSADYIKHEYLPSGQKPETYTGMVSVELLSSGVSLADTVKAQTANRLRNVGRMSRS